MKKAQRGDLIKEGVEDESKPIVVWGEAQAGNDQKWIIRKSHLNLIQWFEASTHILWIISHTASRWINGTQSCRIVLEKSVYGNDKVHLYLDK